MSFFTTDKIKDILKSYNNMLHYCLEQTGDIVLLVKHDLTDPRKFVIIKDNHYGSERGLEGKTLIFDNPDDFKTAFPEFSQPPPVHIPTNMKRNAKTGVIEGIHKDPYPIKEFKSYDSTDVNGLKLVVDMGREIEIGAVWIRFPFGKIERFSIAVANDVENPAFRYIDTVRDIQSKGLTDEYEPFNIETTARYILIIVYENPKLTDIDMMNNNIKVTKAKAII